MANNQTCRYRIIDLFSGAGGFTLGFTHNPNLRGKFQPVWANDNNKSAVATYNANFGNHCVLGDIVDILNHSKMPIPKADVVIGGPPCQGFSLLNKKRKTDERKQLWRPFIEVVNRANADIFVMENVPELLGTLEHEEIMREARDKGFKIACQKLCAADFGVPQLRYRAFIIGCRFTDPAQFFPPLKTHYNPAYGVLFSLFDCDNGYVSKPKYWQTVRDAIADLPAPESTEINKFPPPLNLHFGRNPTPLSLSRYQAIPKEGMNRFDLQRLAPELTPECWLKKKSGGTDLFGRLWWDKPSVTIRTEFFKPEKGRYLHPEQHRPITHREAARLQSFPDDFVFCGSKVEIAKQIGNAVPPLLAAKIADCVYSLLVEINFPLETNQSPEELKVKEFSAIA
jgi:DNA (cytosine-5)-methyltransferase 1